MRELNANQIGGINRKDLGIYIKKKKIHQK